MNFVAMQNYIIFEIIPFCKIVRPQLSSRAVHRAEANVPPVGNNRLKGWSVYKRSASFSVVETTKECFGTEEGQEGNGRSFHVEWVVLSRRNRP